MRKRWFAGVLAVLLLAGCGTGPRGDPAELDKFLQTISASRSSPAIWTAEEWDAFYSAIPGESPQSEPLAPLALDALLTEHPAQTVDRAQAEEDVTMLFQALRESYGAYEYFGGETAFGQAEREVLAYLSRHERFQPQELARRLTQALAPIVQDGHFSVMGDTKTLRPIQDSWGFMYYVPDLYFDDTTGVDPAYVKPTIGPEGRLTWCFAAVSRDGGDLPASAVVGGSALELTWRRAETLSHSDRVPYRRTAAGGIPVLECRTLSDWPDEANVPALERFAASGGEWQKEAVFLLDLRGNSGGNSSYANAWMEGLLGAVPQPRILSAQRYSPLLHRAGETGFFPAFFPVDAEGWDWTQEEQVQLDSGRRILVLTDKNTASSAESFLTCLREAGGVTVIGGNTAGMHLCGNLLTCTMPNSGVRVQFGTKLNFYGDLDDHDGTGYLPDLWVEPADALDAAVRLCRYYGLTGG